MANTLPMTGQEWEDTYGFNPLGIRKGIITNTLIRDYHSYLTNLADPAVGLNADGIFSPYAQDGLYRDDLMDPDFPGGPFLDPGALKDDGVKITSETKVEQTRVAQARRSQRYDLTEEDDEIEFTYREDNPTVDLLRFDKPLVNIPDVGTAGYVQTKPAEGDLVERQIIAFAEDGDHRFAYIFPRVARSKVGDTQLNKKDPHELNLKYGALLCPWAKYPVAIAREGAGWRALGGAPVFPVPAPMAAAVAGGKATVSFTQPQGTGDPWAYTVTKNIGGTETAAVIDSVSVVGITVTITVSGLTTGAQPKFKVKATGSNLASAFSAESNQITAIA